MTNDDLREAEQMERFGDAAVSGQSAAAYYREAQRLVMPAGVVWTDRESYDRRMEAFERIQQKLYGLDGNGGSREISTTASMPQPPTPASTPRELSVWDFSPGLVVRIGQTFRDYDGQEIRAGEVLHFLESSYFFYEAGHTLKFAEKTIRLAGIVDEHEAIIANAGNAWFQPLTGHL
jgi:hypothetical protein